MYNYCTTIITTLVQQQGMCVIKFVRDVAKGPHWFSCTGIVNCQDEVKSIHEAGCNQHSITVLLPKDNSEHFQTLYYFCKFYHNDTRSSLPEWKPSNTESRAKASLILVLNLPAQRSAKYWNSSKRHRGNEMERKVPRWKWLKLFCHLNQLWTEGSITYVRGWQDETLA